MFKLFKNNGNIVTKITKSSSQAAYEEEVYQKAINQNHKCPECGTINKDIFAIGFEYSNGTKVLCGKCKKCGAKWETTYKY